MPKRYKISLSLNGYTGTHEIVFECSQVARLEDIYEFYDGCNLIAVAPFRSILMMQIERLC